MKEILLKIV